jgi:4-amino-4-deoxy-L-arabinose transferase-like glycosyltransferase
MERLGHLAIGACIDGRDATMSAKIGPRLAQLVFVLYCAEALFSLPYRSVYLFRQSIFQSWIAALCLLTLVGVCFRFRLAILPVLGRPLRVPAIGNRAWLLFWLIFGVALRLAWALHFPVTLKSDHLAYYQVAENLALGHSGTGAFWPPGFSLILTPFFYVFGAHPWVAQLCALLFFAATCLLTYALANRIHGGLAARIAAMLVAIWPGYFTLAGINCKEVFLAVLAPAALLFYLKASDSGTGPAGVRFRWRFVIAAGLCIGFAALTQPGFMLFPAVILGFEMLRSDSVLRAFARTAVFSIAMIAAILPWTCRNFLAFHRIVLISTNGGSVFYRANNPLANGNYLAEGEVPLPKDEFAADQLGYIMAEEWIVHHPGDFAALMVRKQIVFLGDDALGAFETLKRNVNSSGALYASVKGISNLFWLAAWTVLFIGFPLLFRLDNWRLWFGLLFLPLLYEWVIVSIFESGPRHHVPFVSLLSVLVAMVLSSAAQSIPSSARAASQT